MRASIPPVSLPARLSPVIRGGISISREKNDCLCSVRAARRPPAPCVSPIARLRAYLTSYPVQQFNSYPITQLPGYPITQLPSSTIPQFNNSTIPPHQLPSSIIQQLNTPPPTGMKPRPYYDLDHVFFWAKCLILEAK